MRFLRAVGVLVLLIGFVAVVAFVMGSILPAEHTVSTSVTVPATASRVWDILEDLPAQPSWRTGLKSIDINTRQSNEPCWTEHYTNGMSLPLCEAGSSEIHTRVVRIADPNLGYGGSWSYLIWPDDQEGTRVTITETGTTNSPFWRFFGHYIFHEDANIKRYAADLLKRAQNS